MGYSRLNNDTYVHVLVLETCDDYFISQKEPLEVIKLNILRLGDYSRLSEWPDIITGIHITGTQEESELEGKVI